jgi:hypothetical protein
MPKLLRTARSFFGLSVLCALSACDPAQTLIFDIDPEAPEILGVDAGQAHAGSGAAGASGTTAAGSGAAGKSSTTMQQHFDPNATFNWTETAPGHGTCEPERFVGNFSCDITPGLIETQLEGSISLEFSGSSENTVFGVSKGMLTAFVLDDTRVLLQAPLTGELSCSTHMLNAELTKTKTEVLPLETQLGWLVLFMSQLDTTGQLNGAFDARGLTISGDITLQFEPQTKCIGTFELFASQ